MRTQNAKASFHDTDRYAAASASMTPRRRPPTMAPGMFPMPPRIAAVNAFIP